MKDFIFYFLHMSTSWSFFFPQKKKSQDSIAIHQRLLASRTQSSNSTESPTGGVATFSSEGGAFTKVRTPPMEEVKKSRLAEVADLIHLESPITEDLVIRTLQARFVNQKFMVRNFAFIAFHEFVLYV